MNLSTDIKPISHLQAHASEVFAQLNETHRPMVITEDGEAKAVLQDIESFESMRNALGLLKLLAQGERDIENDAVVGNDEVFSKLENLLAEK